MRQVFPESRDVDDELSIYDDLVFPDPPNDRPFIIMNMVTSADGKAQIGSRAAGLGSEVDRGLMLRIRALADAVIQGAGTARQERIYRKLPQELKDQRQRRGQEPEPLMAIVSQSLDIPTDSALFRKPARRPVVFCAETSPAERIGQLQTMSTVVISGQCRPAVGKIVHALRRDFGVRYLLCEGGPTLNRTFFEAGLVDEFFLTFAPKVVAGDAKTAVEGQPLASGEQPKLQLMTIFERDSELFLRYRVLGR